MTISNQQNGHSNQNDPAFNAVQKTKPSFHIWRLENFQLVPIPKDSYGTFFKGDTYLIYHSYEIHKAIVQHIHIWIGVDSTADEQGVAAFKMVELDEFLGGTSVQHRECQSYESERFSSYFKQKGGLKYQIGGVQSGFHHYEKNFEPRLFQVKGKRNVRLNELNSIEWSAMNRNDSFLIDFNSTIYVWNGKLANKMEKLQALNKARMFRDERNGDCNIVIVEDGEEKDLPKDELKLFESKFPLKEKLSKLKNDLSCHDDLKFENDSFSYIKLYKCSDALNDGDGMIKIKIIEQKTGPLYKEDLISDDSYIVDNGKYGIWVWVGKKSSQKERKEAMRNALGFLQAKGYDENQQNAIKVTRVFDGSEPVEFKALFNRWPEVNETKCLNRAIGGNSFAKTLQSRFDASVLHSNHHIAAESQLIDDGKGFKQIWYIHNFDLHKLDSTKYSEFYTGDCYIIHYKYKLDNIEKHIFYYWIGKKSTLDEQEVVALKTIELDNEICHGQALQVRVVEGKEPIHFMSIFEGRIIIYKEGKAFGPKNCKTTEENEKMNKNYMLQVKSYGPSNIKAIEVDCSALSLNSNDVFIICHNSEIFYIWCGKSSTGDEREAAKSIVLSAKQEPEIIIESQEKNEFWSCLGGKAEYQTGKRFFKINQTTFARLFEISNSSGRLNVNEILQFSQADLNSNDMMLLDLRDYIFLWTGSNLKIENNESEKIAIEYLKSDPSQRLDDIPIYKIRQGFEPPIFTGFFGHWDPNFWIKKNDSDYSFVKQELQSKNQPHLFQLAVMDKSKIGVKNKDTIDFNKYPKYSYEELIKSAEELPENVLNEAKEVHLTDEDFIKIFKISYQQFKEKPFWKQKELKRSVRLF